MVSVIYILPVIAVFVAVSCMFAAMANFSIVYRATFAIPVAVLAIFLPSSAAHAQDASFWTDPLIPGGWMAWTGATALFFAIIAGLLIVMTILAIRYPETPRLGVLRIETTRGDRLFISLLGSGFINLVWLNQFGSPLWGALIVCLIYAAAVFRWV